MGQNAKGEKTREIVVSRGGTRPSRSVFCVEDLKFYGVLFVILSFWVCAFSSKEATIL